MRALDAFVGAVVDDAQQEWLGARDADRAFDRNECTRANLAARPAVCVRHLALALALQGQRRAGRPVTPQQQLQLNNLSGRCAEQHTLRRLCLGRGRFDVFNQARARPRDASSPRLDIGGFHSPRLGRRALRGGLEIKHLHLPAFVDATGALHATRLAAQVQADARQVLAQQAAVAAPGARAGLPTRIRLLYHLGGLGSVRRLEARRGIGPQRSVSSARPMPAAAVAAAGVIRAAAARAGVSAFVVGARL